MSGDRRPPQARDRVIGARLKVLRTEQTTLSLEKAAELAQFSPSTLSRIENGKRHITSDEVATLCTIYGTPAAQRTELVDFAKAGNSNGWWDKALPGIPRDVGTLASYEADAVALTDWSPNLIPGLLHTYGYAASSMIAEGFTDTEMEIRWLARLRRQQILGSVDYVALLGEAALRTPFGGREAMKEQLLHLINAYERGIVIRVVPAHTPHVALLHSWLFLEFPHTGPVVCADLIQGGVFLHGDDALVYKPILKGLDRIALAASASRDLVRKVIKEHG